MRVTVVSQGKVQYVIVRSYLFIVRRLHEIIGRDVALCVANKYGLGGIRSLTSVIDG